MKRIALLVTTLLAMAGADAQVYQYKDAAGRTVYSDQPPPAGTKSGRTISSEPNGGDSDQARRSVIDRDAEFKKRQQSKKEQATKELNESTANADRRENCSSAQKQLTALESGLRMSTQNEAGERSFMDDNQRAKEIERTKRAVADNCGK